ncbi:MAG: glycogen debranching protein GlgX [Chloroflexota bacterium]|nr:glycogen debranching protein GlgX [Chloroflexota bacterium]
MSTDDSIEVLPGHPHPLGATVQGDGVNFSLFSANARGVQLLLFDRSDEEPVHTIMLDPEENKTYYYWHAFVRGIGDGQIYAYRVDGPYEPERGMRFDSGKVLLDPYALAVDYGEHWARKEAIGSGENTLSALKCVVVDPSGYDWEGDEPLERPMDDTVIYEMHVKGFTAHPSSGVSCRGTYAGLVEKIPYLRDLGVTAVELLPVQQFDPQEVVHENPVTGEPLTNYWGYAPLAYFAPHVPYTCSKDARDALDEFRDMVKALHRAGIEVILDVVFNHTAEGGCDGPTISFRGIENVAYYMLKPNRREYYDFTGTGNTINSNHSVVRRLIRECLRYWVDVLHVDGFRFDLASVLSRNEQGEPISDSPILWGIESDPVLAGTKLIAEAWDAAGLYELGAFTGDRWAEWNGRFRDDVRRFVRGDEGMVKDFARRMAGSFDIFRDKPSYCSQRSINYVTCHDGFTLADLVSYEKKHNEANGAGNEDGTDQNYSCNYGIEGPTHDSEIRRLRRRQMKNMIALLLMARGTPMLLGGDEMARTQEGNNNAYCQDNETSWFNWERLEENEDLHRFTRLMIALRRQYPTLTMDHVLGRWPYQEALHEDLTFHGVRLRRPDWGYWSHSLAIQFHDRGETADFFLIANAYTKPLAFEIPPKTRWKRVVDTSLESPEEIVRVENAPLVETSKVEAGPRSVIVLIEAKE